jgi:hypothetical protein
MKPEQRTQVLGNEIKLLQPDFHNIPPELQSLPWALWKAELELNQEGAPKLKPNGKPRIKKAPRGINGINISKSKPEQWATFEDAQKAYQDGEFTGLGVLLQAESGLVGIDLDDVPDLIKKTPHLKPLLDKAKHEALYCEKSPSGNGLRLFAKGSLPGNNGRRKGGIELYADSAFLTVTGQILWKGEIRDAQWIVDELLGLIDTNTSLQSTTLLGLTDTKPSSITAQELSAWASHNHPQLWEGRWDKPELKLLEKEYPSQSEADMALVGHLAREATARKVGPDLLPIVVWECFQKSALYRPEKERQITTYAIPKAIQSALEAPKADTHPKIAEVNKRFALIEGVGIYDRQNNKFFSKEQFQMLYQNQFINLGTPENPKLRTLDRVWLANKYRAQFSGLDLAPGEPERTRCGALNTYRGFSVEPIAGDIQPYMDLLSWNIPDEEEQKYLLNFMAYKVQNPASKYSVAAVLWSNTQGVGKNLLAETFAGLFDQQHWCVVGQEVFSDQFTEWQHLKLVVIGDEVSSTSSRTQSDRIKGWITATQNRINPKNSTKFQEPNLMCYIFLSNHPDAVFMDATDRRFWVAECASQRPNKDLIQRFIEWRDGRGKATLLHHLLNRDTGDFDSKAPAPNTKAKQEMIEDNRSGLERWLDEIMQATSISDLIGREVVTASEMTEAYKRSTTNNLSSKVMNNALRKANALRLTKQAQRRSGKRPRAYALANKEHYEKMTSSELGTYLDNNPLKPFF